jgi:NAD-dependent histone deacetylase SIR2/NAD-dependent deacetylase sirtuin 2
MSDFKDADLLITIGTSLKVHPFASLIDRVDDQCPRLLINLESVGEIDEEEAYSGGTMFGRYREDGFDFNGLGNGGKQFARDVKWLGEADKGIRQLAQLLGWESELDELYQAGHADLEGKTGKADISSDTAVSADSSSATSDAETKAEETAAKIGEMVDQPSDARQVHEARKTEEETFDKLAQELDKLGVQTTGTAPADKDTHSAEAGQRDDSDKKAAL